jgi:hypothetical protein
MRSPDDVSQTLSGERTALSSLSVDLAQCRLVGLQSDLDALIVGERKTLLSLLASTPIGLAP